METELLAGWAAAALMCAPYAAGAALAALRKGMGRPWRRTLVFWTGASLLSNGLCFAAAASFCDFFWIDPRPKAAQAIGLMAWGAWSMGMVCSAAAAFMLDWCLRMAPAGSRAMEMLLEALGLQGSDKMSSRAAALLWAAALSASFCAVRLLMR